MMSVSFKVRIASLLEVDTIKVLRRARARSSWLEEETYLRLEQKVKM